MKFYSNIYGSRHITHTFHKLSSFNEQRGTHNWWFCEQWASRCVHNTLKLSTKALALSKRKWTGNCCHSIILQTWNFQLKLLTVILEILNDKLSPISYANRPGTISRIKTSSIPRWRFKMESNFIRNSSRFQLNSHTSIISIPKWEECPGSIQGPWSQANHRALWSGTKRSRQERNDYEYNYGESNELESVFQSTVSSTSWSSASQPYAER